MSTVLHPDYPDLVCHSDGRIFSNKKKAFLNESKCGGYRTVWHKKNHFVHRLVAQAFHGKRDLTVNHKNGIKDDNRADNLEWATYSQNVKHAFDTGLAFSKKGQDRHNAKIDEIQALTIITFLNAGIGYRRFTTRFNYCSAGISQRIACDANWKHLSHIKNMELINKRKIQYAKS